MIGLPIDAKEKDYAGNVVTVLALSVQNADTIQREVKKMKMTIDKLIVFCKNLEKYHSTRCKRYDDASGYTRSRNEEIRTNDAKREEMDSKFYHELKEIVRKYQKITEIVAHYRENVRDKVENENMEKILEVIEDEKS